MSLDSINHVGAKKHYDKGKELLKAGPKQNLEVAIAEISKAIFLIDDNPEYFEARGNAYMMLKDYKTAVSNFKRALKLKFTSELARRTSNLLDAEGLARLHAKEYTEAVHYFSAAIDTDPSNLYCLVHRSLAFIGQGKLDDAVRGLGTYLNKETRDDAKLLIHLLVARINKQLKNPTMAAIHVNHALKIDAVNEEALRLYVQLKGRAGELYAEATDNLLKSQPHKAIDCLKHAIELDNMDTRFLVRRGVIHRQLGQYNEATADLEKALEMTSGNNPDALRQLAITYNQLGIELYAAKEYQQALDVFELALKHDQESASVHVNRGDCHREMQEIQAALQDYMKAFELNKDDTEIRIRLSTLYDARGLTFFDRGMLDQAQKEFSEAIKYLPQVPHYYIHRASVLLELGDLDQAVHDYRTVIKIDPHNEHAWAKLSSLGDDGGVKATQRASPPTRIGRMKGTSLGRSKISSPIKPGDTNRSKQTLNRSVSPSKDETKALRPALRTRSPTRQTVQERDYMKALAISKEVATRDLRTQIAYKSDKRLDTTSIDEKYANIVSGLPASGVRGVAHPYPSPHLR